MDRTPRPGELYRHFKDKIYQIITIAIHSETGEQMVVYQAMYGDFAVYARPLTMFLSEVDHEKYPMAAQTYRFEKIDRPGHGQPAARSLPVQEQRPRTQSPAASKRALQRGADELTEQEGGYLQKRRRQIAEREQRREQFRKPVKHASATDELRANPSLLKFLDADTYEKKYQVLNEIEDDMTNRLIDDIAVVLDVVIPEGPLSDRYYQLKNIILTRQKYEKSRLR